MATDNTYFQERMDLLGVTDKHNTVALWEVVEGENKLVPAPIFTGTERGIDILVYSLDRKRINYAKEGSRWKTQVYKITRLAEPKIKKNGDTQKYDMPKGQPVQPFFPPQLVQKYDDGVEIPVLYMTEGYFKAFKADMEGIDCIGLPSITAMRNPAGELHDDIKKVLIKCKVKRFVWLTDGDCRDITGKEITDGIDLYKRPHGFFKTVSAFYDLLSSFEDLQKYWAYINSADLPGKPKGLDDLLCPVTDDNGEVLQPDKDAIVKELCKFDKIKEGFTTGTFVTKTNVTFGVGKVHKHFLLHDVTLFYLHHVEQRPDMKGKEFRFNGTLYKYDENEAKCVIIIPGDAKHYFRVGDNYYEYINIPDQYGNRTRTYHRRDKKTIQDDHGKEFFRHIPKYKAFCNVPDHVNYQRVIDSCFNIYHPFEHEVEDGDCPVTMNFIKHIFGEEPTADANIKRYELGLDYLQLLYKKPQQILPILCLVSTERETGKTTFTKWLKMIFAENLAIVGNEDLAGQFNAHWTSKLLICCDETKIDKHTVVERIKSLSTSNEIIMNAKGRDQVNMKFFGKFILNSNNEDNFINIDEEEIRFWVIKVKSIAVKNQYLLEELFEEIPAFLNFLNQRRMATPERSRHWFDTPLLRTEALEKLISTSKPTVEKQIRTGIAELFNASEYNNIQMPLQAIVGELLKGKYERDYVIRTLHKMGYKSSEKTGRCKYPRLFEEFNSITNEYETKVKLVSSNNRYYEFKAIDFIGEERSSNVLFTEPNQAQPAPVEQGNLPF